MRDIKGLIRKNLLFVIMAAVAAVCLIKHYSCLPCPVVSIPDSTVAFSTEQDILEQTWQPRVKRISGVSISCEAQTSFDSSMKLRIYKDDYSAAVAEADTDCSFTAGASEKLRFDFPTVDVVPGERYRIQLSYNEHTAEGSLLLDAGTNYDGCSIDGTGCGQAAAFEITVVKNSRLFWLFAIWFPIVGFSLFMMVMWNRKWEETVGLSLIATVFILYAAGLTEHLRLGIGIVYGISAICFAASVYFYNRKGMNLRDLWSPGAAVYGALALLILMNSQSLWLGRWDEYSHWGLAVKDMFFYDSFAKHYNTTVLLPRYLPFSTLFEYFYVYCNGMFTQKLLYAAYQTAALSMLIVVCRTALGKRRYIPAVVAVVFLAPLLFYFDAYNSIYVDFMLAALTAYVLMCYFGEGISAFNTLRIAAGLFALATAKEAGVVIAGILSAVMLGDLVCRHFGGIKIRLKNWIVMGIYIGTVLGSFLSWQLYLHVPAKVPETVLSDAPAAADTYKDAFSASRLSLSGIAELLNGEAPTYKYEALKNFVRAVFSNNIYNIGDWKVSYIDLLVIMFAAAVILYYLGFWRNAAVNMLSFGIFVLIGGVGYCAFLELMYLFAFSQYEAVNLSSYDRYLGSYICGAFIAFLYCILAYAGQAGDVPKGARAGLWEKVIPVLVTALLVVSVPVEGFFIKNLDSEVTEEMVYGEDQLEEVLSSFARRGEKIYFVCNGTNGYSRYVFGVTACPLRLSKSAPDILGSVESIDRQRKLDEENGVTDILCNSHTVSESEWSELLQDCDYVFIRHPYELFKEDYKGLFEDPVTVDDGTFYRVVKQDGAVLLHYIGKVGLKEWK